MEVSTNSASDFFSKINSFQEIIPYSSVKTSSDSTRVSLLKRRKPLDKDALLAVKVDPAVLEAQVTVDTRAKATGAPPQQVDLALFAKSKRGEPSYPSFEEALSMQQAALLKLSPLQLELLMAFADTLRQQRLYTQRHLECAFCKNNGSPVSWYASHALRDRRRVRCPVLRALRCPRCGATGDRAHTIKYCPLNFFSEEAGRRSVRRPRSPATRQTSVRCKPERSCYYWAHCSSHESPIQCLFKCSRLGVIHVKSVQKFERKTDENISCGLNQKSTISARPTTGLSRWVENADILCCGHATDAGKKSNTIENLVHSITIKIKRREAESNVFEQRSWNIARRTVNIRTRRRISDGLSPIGANQIRALSLHCY